ncbi:MAG TPA: bifunctional phosphoglucose/phosphomannose isomerase [Candidatus Sulfotelmatobacter sp.]|nr:bifunctional phosphoglucose/phosphomannose isomerase [Candidatus Sulfotelmatobacter sp.]
MNAAPGLEPPYGSRDAHDMGGRIARIPEQIEEALAAVRATPWRVPGAAPDLLAAGGMGGSAIAADLVSSLEADRLPRPLVVVREYRWPACVTSRSLALLCSYSGNTEETLALEAEASRRGIPRVALTTGGELAARCERSHVFAMRMPGGSPPRAALYGAWVRVSALLSALGWLPDPGGDWERAAHAARAAGEALGPARAERENPAKQLARALAGRHVFLYAASERLGAVATRWRQQINENAKVPAHSALVPELNHNEIVGWESGGAFAAQSAVVLLRDPEDAADVATRLALTGEYAARQGARVHQVSVPGESRLERAVRFSQYGDWVSFYLALLNGVDATPIASIDEFKRRLDEAGRRGRA